MPVRVRVWILFADCDGSGLSMLDDGVALGTEVVSFVGTTLSCRRFLRTCPLGVSTMYDLGVSADVTTHPEVLCPSVVTHTSVSSGIVGKSEALCRWS